MNTTFHAAFNSAVLGKKKDTWKPALLGSLAPDAFTFLFFFGGFLPSVGMQRLWDEIYFSTPFYQFFSLTHSFVLWGLLLLTSYILKKKWLRIFSLSGLLHVAFDFPLHAEDPYMHFYPLSTWKFSSPVSYWDPNYYGWIIGPIDLLLTILLCIYLYKRYKRNNSNI